jgi:hypothetical protein
MIFKKNKKQNKEKRAIEASLKRATYKRELENLKEK